MNDKCHNYNTAAESDAVNYVFIHLQGLGSSQLADHVVNEINQGPWYHYENKFTKLVSFGIN